MTCCAAGLVWTSVPTRQTQPQPGARTIITPPTCWVVPAFYTGWIETTSWFSCNNNEEHIQYGWTDIHIKFTIHYFVHLIRFPYVGHSHFTYLWTYCSIMRTNDILSEATVEADVYEQWVAQTGFPTCTIILIQLCDSLLLHCSKCLCSAPVNHLWLCFHW